MTFTGAVSGSGIVFNHAEALYSCERSLAAQSSLMSIVLSLFRAMKIPVDASLVWLGFHDIPSSSVRGWGQSSY